MKIHHKQRINLPSERFQTDDPRSTFVFIKCFADRIDVILCAIRNNHLAPVFASQTCPRNEQSAEEPPTRPLASQINVEHIDNFQQFCLLFSHVFSSFVVDLHFFKLCATTTLINAVFLLESGYIIFLHA